MPTDEIKGLAVKIALEDGTFQQGVTNLKQNLNMINSEFKASVAGVKDWGNSLDSLKNNATSLGEKITVQKQIVQSYQEQLVKSKTTLSENSDKMMELKSKLDSTKSAYEASLSAVGANDEATKKLKTEVDALNDKYTSSEKLVRSNNSSVNEYTKQTNEANGAVNKLEGELKQTNDQIKNQTNEYNGLSEKINSKVNGALKGLAVGIGAAVVGLGAMIMKSAENADSIQTTAEIYGMTAERVQELTYVGTKLDVELDTMTKGQTLLTKNMLLAGKATSEQAIIFKALKVDAYDPVTGAMRDSKDVMAETITALGKMKNETERDAYAMKLFGKSALELNPLIKAGGDEIARLTEEAHKSGAVMSNEAVRGLDEFGDSAAALKLSLQGVIGNALQPLVPKLQEFTDKLKNIDTKPLTDGLKWVMDHGGLIIGVISTFTGLLVAYKIAWALSTIPLIAHNIAAAALAITHGVVAAATGIVTAAQWLWNAAMTANPIGLLIVGVAALVAAIGLLVYAYNDASRAAAEATVKTTAENKKQGEAERAEITKTADAKKKQIADKTDAENKYYNEQTALLQKQYDEDVKNGQKSLDALKANLAERQKAEDNRHSATIQAINDEYGVFEEKNKSKTEIVQALAKKQIDLLNEELATAKTTCADSIAKINEEYGVFDEKHISKTQLIQDEYTQKSTTIADILSLSQTAATQEGEAFQKSSADILAKAQELHNEKIAMYSEEYLLSLGIINDDLKAKVKGFQDEITNIQKKTDEENAIIKAQDDAQKIADLQKKVDDAKTDADKIAANEALQTEINRQNREKLLEQRADQTTDLNLKIKEATTKATEEKGSLLAKLQEKIAGEQIEIKKNTDYNIAKIQEERKAKETAETAKLTSVTNRVKSETDKINTKVTAEIAKIQEERKAKETAETAKYNAAKKSMDDEGKSLNTWLEKTYQPALDKKLKKDLETESARHKPIMDDLAAEAAAIDKQTKANLASSIVNEQAKNAADQIVNLQNQITAVQTKDWIHKDAILDPGKIKDLNKQIDAQKKILHDMKIPGYAVGTRFLPQDMIVYAHQGEMIVPRSENPYANSDGGTMPGGMEINISVGTLVGSNGMKEFADMVSREVFSKYQLCTGGS